LLELIDQADASDERVSESASNLQYIDIASKLCSGRTAKQCRDRYQNYLRDGIKKGDWTVEESELIKDMYATFGAR
jgi:Myb-like DNA-binding domain